MGPLTRAIKLTLINLSFNVSYNKYSRVSVVIVDGATFLSFSLILHLAMFTRALTTRGCRVNIAIRADTMASTSLVVIMPLLSFARARVIIVSVTTTFPGRATFAGRAIVGVRFVKIASQLLAVLHVALWSWLLLPVLLLLFPFVAVVTVQLELRVTQEVLLAGKFLLDRVLLTPPLEHDNVNNRATNV